MVTVIFILQYYPNLCTLTEGIAFEKLQISTLITEILLIEKNVD